MESLNPNVCTGSNATVPQREIRIAFPLAVERFLALFPL